MERGGLITLYCCPQCMSQTTVGGLPPGSSDVETYGRPDGTPANVSAVNLPNTTA